jgi:hypothetical protein
MRPPDPTPEEVDSGERLHVPEPHDLEADQDSYQRGLQEGRAATARARELGCEPDPEPDAELSAGSRGQRQAYRRGYRAGLSD